MKLSPATLWKYCVAEDLQYNEGQKIAMKHRASEGGRVPPSLVLAKGAISFFN